MRFAGAFDPSGKLYDWSPKPHLVLVHSPTVYLEMRQRTLNDICACESLWPDKEYSDDCLIWREHKHLEPISQEDLDELLGNLGELATFVVESVTPLHEDAWSYELEDLNFCKALQLL